MSKKWGLHFCSRECHYQARRDGRIPHIVTKKYDISEKVRLAMSHRSAVAYAKGTTFPFPKTEIAVSKSLRRMKIQFTHQHVVDTIKRSYVVDFFFPFANLAIELDERSLHKKRRDRDREQDELLSAMGIKVVRVPDDGRLGAAIKNVCNALAEHL